MSISEIKTKDLIALIELQKASTGEERCDSVLDGCQCELRKDHTAYYDVHTSVEWRGLSKNYGLVGWNTL